MCSVKGREMAWKFVQDNWDEFHNRYEGGFLLSRLIKVNARLHRRFSFVAQLNAIFVALKLQPAAISSRF